MILHSEVNVIQCNTAMIAGKVHLGFGRFCVVFSGPRVDLFLRQKLFLNC